MSAYTWRSFYNKLLHISDLNSAYGKKVSKLAFRVRFQSIVQHESQSFDDYLADFSHSSIDYDFDDQLDNCLNNKVVVGLRSDQIKTKLLEDENKSLADIVKSLRDLERVNRKSTSNKSAPTSAFSAHQVRSGTNQTRFVPGFFNLNHLSRHVFRLSNHRPITLLVYPVTIVVFQVTNLTNVL